MTRPLRVELSDSYYHVMARGNRRESIYLNDEDRRAFLGLLDRLYERLGWTCYAYCLMTNHYHLLLHTPGPDLSKGMRELNGIYTQGFNRRHRRAGHVLQGRYTAHLVDKDSYLKELSRYVVLNPVRAGMVQGPRQYPWSSYRATTGQTAAPRWLNVDDMLKQFGKRRPKAISAYKEFVRDGMRNATALEPPKFALFHGNDEFIQRSVKRLHLPDNLEQVSRHQKRVMDKPLEWYFDKHDRNEAINEAWSSGRYSQAEIARYLNLHYSTISRIITERRE